MATPAITQANVLPLTTTFSPPAQCTTDTWRYAGEDGAIHFVLGGSGYTSCLPTSFTPLPRFYYSPGLDCPSGYVSGCPPTSVHQGFAETTYLTCCPINFTCQLRPKWAHETTLGCTSAITTRTTIIYTSESGEVTSSVWDLGAGVNAYSVELRWQASDVRVTTVELSSSSSSPSPSSTSPTSTPLSNAASTPTSSSSPNPTAEPTDSQNGGLSTGFKIGIGLGTVIGVALIAAILFLAYTIHKRGGAKSSVGDAPQVDDAGQLGDAPHDVKPYGTTPSTGHELPVAENQVYPERFELSHLQDQSYQERHELPGRRL